MRIRGGVIALLASLGITDVVRAQLANVSSLLDRVEDLSVYSIVPVGHGAGNYSSTGYGFGFLFRIGEWKETLSRADRVARCAKLNADDPGSCKPDNTADTTTTISTIRRSGTVAETTFTVTVNQLEYTKWLFELAVASQNIGLRQTDIVPTWHLDGSISEFPLLSAYATYRPARTIAPYVGVSFIQGDLSSVRIAHGDSAATVGTTSNGGALSAGAVWEIHNFGVFGEATYTVLRFDTPDWQRPANFPAGANLPGKLQLTGFTLRIGVQLSLGGDSEK
jgi:hypothetical protein